MRATEIGRLLAQRAEQTAAFLLPGGEKRGAEWFAGSTRGEAGGSLHVILDGPRQGMWRDFAGADDDKGDLIGLWQKARGVSLSAACQEALDWMEVPESVRNQDRPAPPKREPTPKAPDQRWIELQSTMRAGTMEELRTLAALRKLPSIAGLELATRHGHLWFGQVHDHGERHPAWLLTDSARRNAQARKLDGQPWIFDGQRKPAKSKTIWGTDTHWPVGIPDATTTDIAFVEGAPDFLAAWEMIHRKEATARMRPVAMFGASNSIHADALSLFEGRTIWMFPHNDPEGMKAAKRWGNSLMDAGALAVEFYNFAADGLKDLNDLVTADGEAEDEA